MARHTPAVCATPDAIGDEIFAAHRQRPVVATNEKGETVVCCRKTAKRKGWAIQAVCFARAKPE